MKKLFKVFGVGANNLSTLELAQDKTLSNSSVAIVRVDISSITNAHEIMGSIVTSLTKAGYDIEVFLSNILLVPIHNDFQNLKNALSSHLSNKAVSIVTSTVNSYVSVYGNSDRQHYGHLSADTDKLLKIILSIEYGTVKHVA